MLLAVCLTMNPYIKQGFPGDPVVKNQGTQVWSVVREDHTCLGATKPVQPQLLDGACAPHREKHRHEKHLNLEEPLPTATRESLNAARDPAQQEMNRHINFLNKIKQLDIPYVTLKSCCFVYSVQFSRSVASDSLWPHGLQHNRPPCPPPTPGACSNSCPLSWQLLGWKQYMKFSETK